VIDNYRYHLNGAQLSELYEIVITLVAEGYTWRHRYTQCVLYAALSRYRLGSVVGAIPAACSNDYFFDGQFEPANFSQPSTQQTPVGTDLSGNHDKAFSEFQKFVQDLQADDMLALKQYLLAETSYKRHMSVKTVGDPAKPSAVSETEGISAVFLSLVGCRVMICMFV